MRKTNRKECDYNNYRTELAVRMQLSDISASYIICNQCVGVIPRMRVDFEAN